MPQARERILDGDDIDSINQQLFVTTIQDEHFSLRIIRVKRPHTSDIRTSKIAFAFHLDSCKPV